MAINTDSNATLAVLIDADNASAATIKKLLDEVAKYGVASVKRIYGDWTKPNLGPWKDVLLEFSIQPMQQFANTRGKNATDSALIIDAMDLLYSGAFDGFCLVSSDSDFTRLASRLRESGKRVYGFGEKKTPKPFVVACDKFIYTEVFSVTADEPVEGESRRRSTKELRADQELLTLLRAAIDANSDEEGWAHLGAVGSAAVKREPDFDSRNYGYAKLSGLIKAVGLFQIDESNKILRVRDGAPARKQG
ncbi:MAG: NYN domain-containing protein [Steroidobacteraceae bacterium]